LAVLQGSWGLAPESRGSDHSPSEEEPPYPELIREHLVIWGVREEGDTSPLLPPEVRLFDNRYPSHIAKLKREMEERERWERIAEESREATRRIAEHKQLMHDMREWGRANGFFVGARGRISRKVINAYKEAKGL